MRNNKAQQEIVGFVLIVIIVIVGLMIFLVVSLRETNENEGSLEVAQMLDAVMKYTTGCAISYEPDYDTVEDLFKSCHKNYRCSNIGVDACDYLNETLVEALDALIATEASISYYRLEFFENDGAGILMIEDGACSGSIINSAQRSIVSSSDSLTIRMKTCGIIFEDNV